MEPSHCMKLVAKSLALISMLGSLAWAQGGPAENPSQVLTRTSATGLTLQTTLSKNIYRQEAYQTEYAVQVPYQTQEAYTDYETYYDTEYRCSTRYENECRNEQVCDNVSRPQCRQERVCRPTGGGGPRCRTATECGTNARGERICKERQVCDGGSGGGERCDYVERCDHRSERQCRNEYRCHQVPRNHCRNEQVARTRPVTRYRTVTKYRTEMRCCQTQYRNVFDRQETLSVLLQFQPGSELLSGQMEQLRVSLVGSANQPLSVNVEVLSQLHGYRVVNQNNQGGLIVIELEQTAVQYNDSQVGAPSVDGLKLMIKEDESGVVVFNDRGQIGALVTVYDMIVKDDAGNVVAADQFYGNGVVAQRHVLSQRLSLRRGHTLELRVNRSGSGSPISFVKSFYRPR